MGSNGALIPGREWGRDSSKLDSMFVSGAGLEKRWSSWVGLDRNWVGHRSTQHGEVPTSP